jgi:hypothetical protein
VYDQSKHGTFSYDAQDFNRLPSGKLRVISFSLERLPAGAKGSGDAYKAGALNVVLDPRAIEVAFQSHGKD